MITLKYTTINDRAFMEGLKTLVNHPFHLKTSYHLKRIQDKVMSESKAAQAAWQEILTKKVEFNVDEEGKRTTPKDLVALQALEQQFLEIEFTIPKHKVHVNEIIEIKLKPLELSALIPILDGVELLEDEPVTEEKANG